MPNSEPAPEGSYLEILGQRISLPNTIPGAVAWGLMCLTTLWIAYIIAVQMPESRFETLAGLFKAHYYDPQGKAMSSPRTKILGFWTPSVETKKSLKRNSSGTLISPDEKWMEITEEKLTEFEHKLGDIDVRGWRRYPVVGLGRSQVRSEGWWWTVSVDASFDTSDLVRMYSKHWGSKQSLYLEEIGGAAQYKGAEKQ